MAHAVGKLVACAAVRDVFGAIETAGERSGSVGIQTNIFVVGSVGQLDVHIVAVGIDVVLVHTVFSAFWNGEGTTKTDTEKRGEKDVLEAHSGRLLRLLGLRLMAVGVVLSSDEVGTYTSSLVLVLVPISQHVSALDRLIRRYCRVCKAARPDGSPSEVHTRYMNVDEVYDVLAPRSA